VSRWPTGLVVGRFDPPHLGHSHLIRAASALAGTLVVFVNTKDADGVPGELRAAWLAELHPDVVVVEVHHDLRTDWDDEELWARWIALFRRHWPLPDGPHALFSSEGYGSELARRLGAESVVVDEDREAVPVSATMVRTDPLGNLHHLAPPVRAWVEEQARSGRRITSERDTGG
jgi:HTH-type transcriptional regulator, transcriptional repressor of NAD biosynthesis genes